MMTFEDGNSKVLSKIRGEKNVVPTMLDFCKKERQPGTPYLVIRSANLEQADRLTEACRLELGEEPALVYPIGGVIAINAGPNLVGLIYRKKD